MSEPTSSQAPEVAEAPRAPLTTTTSIRPAATVLIAAIVMLVVFVGINAIFDQGVAPSQSTVVIVGGLNINPDAHLFAQCYANGEPPGNIGSAFLVPIDTTALAPVDHCNLRLLARTDFVALPG